MSPIRVYGSKVSYYTGKVEAYLRYQGLVYERLPLTVHRKTILENVGTTQMPAVELEDGRWMSDSTPILLYFEDQHPRSPILPEDPLVRMLALLIEDYADEWLWRPAMHYRWSYRHDRELISGILVDELLEDWPGPRFLKLRMIRRRQRGGFVIGDGVSDSTRAHVEAGYFAALENMTRMLAERPFLLGDAPSIADFGLMGPMLRHFGQDPTPADWMRERGPAVYEWVARTWNTRANGRRPTWVESIPDDAHGMLREIAETHLAQLLQNAEAFAGGASRFDATIQGCAYRALPVSRYRVWCLEELRRRFGALPESDRAHLGSLLGDAGAAILDARTPLPAPSGYDEAREAPFNRAINVYGNGVPR